MNNIASKIFGWILLIGGVGIIGWTLLFSYNVFTGKTLAPSVFQENQTIAKTTTSKGNVASLEDLQQGLGNMIGEQIKGILPSDTLPKILNLTVWSMLAGILIFGGGQISSLGIKLIK